MSVLTLSESLVKRKNEDKLSQASSFSKVQASMNRPAKSSINVSQVSNFGGGVFYDKVLNNNIGVFNNNNILDESIVHVI